VIPSVLVRTGKQGLSGREIHACAFERQFRFRIPASISLCPFNISHTSKDVFRCMHTSTPYPKHLPRRAPDALEEAVLLCEPVEAVVALAHGTDEAADGVWLDIAGVAAVLVNLGDADLDGCVVLGPDDASGGRLEIVLVSRFEGQGKVRRVLTHLGGISIATRSFDSMFGEHLLAGDVEVNELTAFVLHSG
jgi:hypothetical protein